MNKKDIKDILNSEIYDIAEGFLTGSKTSIIFKRKDGSLHGIRVLTDDIELCDFKEHKKEKVKG